MEGAQGAQGDARGRKGTKGSERVRKGAQGGARGRKGAQGAKGGPGSFLQKFFEFMKHVIWSLRQFCHE